MYFTGRRAIQCPGSRGNSGHHHRGPNGQLPPTGFSGGNKKSSSAGGNKKASNKKASKSSSANGDSNSSTAAGNIARTILSNLNIFGE